MIVHLDTSAVLKILIDEPGMHDLREAFNGWQLTGDDLVTYDQELAEAAAKENVETARPGT